MHAARPSGRRLAGIALVLAAILTGAAGLDCDQNAQAEFRQTITPEIADGVKTILGGLIDAFADAIVNAGDEAAAETTTTN